METVDASEIAAAPRPVRDAHVTGRLALEGRSIAEPLVFEDCKFDEEICLDEATVSSVRIVRSDLPALRASNIETRGDVVLDGTSGRVSLDGAHIGGSLRLVGARLTGVLDVSSVRVDRTSTSTTRRSRDSKARPCAPRDCARAGTCDCSASRPTGRSG